MKHDFVCKSLQLNKMLCCFTLICLFQHNVTYSHIWLFFNQIVGHFRRPSIMCVCLCVCVRMLCTRLVTKVIKRKSLWSVERNTCFASCHSLRPSFSSHSSIYSWSWQRWKTHAVCPVGLYSCGWASIAYACMWNATTKWRRLSAASYCLFLPHYENVHHPVSHLF